MCVSVRFSVHVQKSEGAWRTMKGIVERERIILWLRWLNEKHSLGCLFLLQSLCTLLTESLQRKPLLWLLSVSHLPEPSGLMCRSAERSQLQVNQQERGQDSRNSAFLELGQSGSGIWPCEASRFCVPAFPLQRICSMASVLVSLLRTQYILQ